MKFTKVLTHDTRFHADEVVATALLRLAGFDFQVVRTRNEALLTEALADPNTLVLDVGGVFDSSLLNFDHHQDMALPSAAGLIYENFKDAVCPQEAQPFFERFIGVIDAIDTNRNNIFGLMDTLPPGFRNVSGLIGGFNRDVTDPVEQNAQFEKAVDFALSILTNEIHSAVQKARSEAQYSARHVLPNNVAVFEEFSTVWKEKKDHQFAVFPHANGWQIQSIDTTRAVVPESIAACEGFVFRHASGFLAVVKEKEIAIAFALTLPE